MSKPHRIFLQPMPALPSACSIMTEVLQKHQSAIDDCLAQLMTV